jgi:FkbM family methyltransferase
MKLGMIRLFLKIKLGIQHPVNALRHLLSHSNDFSRIPLELIEMYMTNPKIIVEAGAADGVDTQEFSDRFKHVKIIAIEPVFEQYLYLLKKFKDAQNVEILNFALSESDGTSLINLGHSEGNLGGRGSSSLLPPKKHTFYFPEIEFNIKEEVQTKTLTKALEGYQLIDLLWLDIQGKELDVLSASRDTFETKIKMIHLEISKVPLYIGMPKEREVRQFLKDAGFRCAEDRVGAISGNALYINLRFFPKES